MFPGNRWGMGRTHSTYSGIAPEGLGGGGAADVQPQVCREAEKSSAWRGSGKRVCNWGFEGMLFEFYIYISKFNNFSVLK